MRKRKCNAWNFFLSDVNKEKKKVTVSFSPRLIKMYDLNASNDIVVSIVVDTNTIIHHHVLQTVFDPLIES